MQQLAIEQVLEAVERALQPVCRLSGNELRKRFGDILHRNCQGLLEGEAVLVGGADANAIARLGFKVGRSVDAKLVVDDRKGGVVGCSGSRHQTVGEGVARVRVNGTEGADDRICRNIFGYLRAAEADH